MLVFAQFSFGISKKNPVFRKNVHDFEKCFSFVKQFGNLKIVCISQKTHFLKSNSFQNSQNNSDLRCVLVFKPRCCCLLRKSRQLCWLRLMGGPSRSPPARAKLCPFAAQSDIQEVPDGAGSRQIQQKKLKAWPNG